MIPKSKIKLIKSLEYRKFRAEHRLFVAEGNRMVTDLLRSKIAVSILYATETFLKEHSSILPSNQHIVACSQEEIAAASHLRSPQEALLLCHLPEYSLQALDTDSQLVLCLDHIQDPGNVGTIVRVADWFGITDVVCSLNTADIYAPKAVQATMGSIARVRAHYTDLQAWLEPQAGKDVAIMGTFLNGENLFGGRLPKSGIVVVGNEGNGISEAIAPLVSHRLTIPGGHPTGEGPESLNVALATAIFCAEFFRQKGL